MEREPCPDRIIDDTGSAFMMGGLGGSVWHGVKGYMNSPKGDKLAGAILGAKSRAPLTGGSFAVWGGIFSIFDCTLLHIRKKEDPWNSIASGGITGAVLSARGGWKAAAKNGAMGAALLGVIEGLGIALGRLFAQDPSKALDGMMVDQGQPAPAGSPSAPSSTLGSSTSSSSEPSPFYEPQFAEPKFADAPPDQFK